MTEKETNSVKAMALLGVIAAVPLIPLWHAVWCGLALSVLWGWFIVPLFTLPAIGLWQAYGITLTFSALRGLGRVKETRTGMDVWLYVLFNPPFACGLLLGFGWFVKGWV